MTNEKYILLIRNNSSNNRFILKINFSRMDYNPGLFKPLKPLEIPQIPFRFFVLITKLFMCQNG